MLGKYLEEGGGYQALSATTCATVVPLWGHLDENHLGDDGDNGKNNDDDDGDDDDDDAQLHTLLVRKTYWPLFRSSSSGLSPVLSCNTNPLAAS